MTRASLLRGRLGAVDRLLDLIGGGLDGALGLLDRSLLLRDMPLIFGSVWGQKGGAVGAYSGRRLRLHGVRLLGAFLLGGGDGHIVGFGEWWGVWDRELKGFGRGRERRDGKGCAIRWPGGGGCAKRIFFFGPEDLFLGNESKTSSHVADSLSGAVSP